MFFLSRSRLNQVIDARVSFAVDARLSVESGIQKRTIEDCADAVHEILMLQQKFDALCDALGIVVVADLNGDNPSAVVATTIDREKSDNAKKYLQLIVLSRKMKLLEFSLLNELKDNEDEFIARVNRRSCNEL